MTNKQALENQALIEQDSGRFSRRNFLTFLGASTGVAALAAACNKDDDVIVTDNGVDLGSGDFGILNYAYALEQLEAAFYTQVMASSSNGLSVSEATRFNEIMLHEVAHREFFKNALGTHAIPGLEVNFSSINFGSRASILATAQAFENLGVKAYNGAGQLITDPTYLLLAGKIVSVEARHASYINDLVLADSFASDANASSMGLDMNLTPPEVLAIAGAYIKTKIDASHLPS